MTGLWVAAAAIAVALAFGGFRALTDGRFRGTHAVRGAETPSDGSDTTDGTDGADVAPGSSDGQQPRGSVDVPVESTWAQLGGAAGSVALGERATLVQFSSAFCAPCRATRRVLSEVADVVPGVVHVEIDAEHHLDAVRRLGILRTPTTLVLDQVGREITRAAGAPRKEQVLAVLPATDLA
jgi:thiol-disulfide isomerase/thioredoxin